MPMIQFRQTAVENVTESLAVGRPVYEDGIEALITVDAKSNIVLAFAGQRRGESDAAFEERLPQEIRLRWLPNLQSYLKGVEFCDGTPLAAMPWITAGAVETLRSAGVGSVESLASVSEGVIEPFGLDGRDLKAKARAWLADRSGEAVAQIRQQADKLAMLEEERAMMLETMQAMQAKIEALEAARQVPEEQQGGMPPETDTQRRGRARG